MRVLENNKNLNVLVDDEDYQLFSKFKWTIIYKREIPYVIRGQWISETKSTKIIYLHRLLVNAKNNDIVDHINGNTLDNTRANLRICSSVDNSRNQKLNKKNKTGYKGVFYNKRLKSKPYSVHIGFNNKTIFCGYYSTKEEAASAYNDVAIKFFGEFARLNKI